MTWVQTPPELLSSAGGFLRAWRGARSGHGWPTSIRRRALRSLHPRRTRSACFTSRRSVTHRSIWPEEMLHLEGITEVQYIPHGTRYIPGRAGGVQGRHVDVERRRADSAHGRQPADRRAGRGSRRLLRSVRQRARARDPRLARKDRRDQVLRERRSHPAVEHAGLRGHRPARRSTGSPEPPPCRRDGPFASGKADAFVGFAQEPVELRARKIGHVIVNTTTTGPGRSTTAAWWLRTASSRTQPSGDQARAARDPQGRRHLRRQPRAGRPLPVREALRAALSRSAWR